MVPPGAVEVIVGASVDPQFGPVVVFGLGGVLVELFKDSSLRLAPVTRAEALDMIARHAARPCCAAIAAARPRTWRRWRMRSAACRTWPRTCGNEIAAIDVNPLMILPVGQGVVAADALVIKR